MDAKNRLKITIVAAAMIVLAPEFFAFAQTATSTASAFDLQSIIRQLQEQIKSLQTQVTELQSQLETVKTELKFTKTLQRGASGEEVKALQEFLKKFPDIYPEGLVTGYYGALTEQAVKRLQEKQGLEPVGALGPKTRAILNELIGEGTGSSGLIPPGLLTAPGLQIAPGTTAQGTTTLPVTAPATPAVPIGQTGTTTVPAIPATPATSTSSALATTTPTMTCGRTLSVPSEKYPNIQSALDASCIGDVIRIASGAYFGKFNLTSKHSGITITGAGLSETVIQGSGSWVFYINNLKNLAIKNLTIVRGGGRNIDGGGIWVANSENIVLEGCRISESTANQGGALAIQNSSVTITRCLFDRNTAYNSAGGIIIRDNSKVSITNATIAYNTALGCHGGGLQANNSSVTVKNSILWGNAASQPAGSGCGWGPAIYGNPTVSYSDIQFGFKGAGNIDSNPYFVSAPGGDFHLSSPSSPAYNSGDPITLDPDGTRADMGVFPYGVIALAPVVVPTPTPTVISVQTPASTTATPTTTTTTTTTSTTPTATTAAAISILASGSPLSHPEDVAVSGNDYIVSDWAGVSSLSGYTGRLLRITSGGSISTIISRPGRFFGLLVSGGDFITTHEGALVRVKADGALTTIAAGLVSPGFNTGITAHGSDFIVTDYNNRRLLRVTLSGAVSVIASGLGNIASVAYDGANFVTVDGAVLRRITPSGSISTIATLPRNVNYHSVVISGSDYIVNNAGLILRVTPSGQISTIIDLSEGYQRQIINIAVSGSYIVGTNPSSSPGPDVVRYGPVAPGLTASTVATTTTATTATATTTASTATATTTTATTAVATTTTPTAITTSTGTTATTATSTAATSTNYPDFLITSFTMAPSQPSVGQSVQFTAVVKNQGNASAGATTFALNNTAAATMSSIGLNFFTADISALSADQSVSIVSPSVTIPISGRYIFSAVVNPDGVIMEGAGAGNNVAGSIVLDAVIAVVPTITTLPAPTYIRADWSYGWWDIRDNTMGQRLITQYPTNTDSKTTKFRLYRKWPGDSAFSVAAEFAGIDSTLCGSNPDVVVGEWILDNSSCGNWVISRVKSGITSAYTMTGGSFSASSYTVGDYSYYLAAVDATGKEGLPSPTATLTFLDSLTIISPTATQSPTSLTPTFQWTTGSNWSSLLPQIIVFDSLSATNPFWTSGDVFGNSKIYNGPALDPAKRYRFSMYGITANPAQYMSRLGLPAAVSDFWVTAATSTSAAPSVGLASLLESIAKTLQTLQQLVNKMR